MARYIDADKLKEEILQITVTVMGGRSCGKTIFEQALNSYREEVLKRTENAPTADVVPKNEVDWHREAELNAQRIIELEAELSKAKSEVDTELPCVAYNKKHERYQVIHKGKQGHIFASKLYRNRREAENALTERKKKYTEEKNNDNK